jgi:hypothetical protein
MKRASSKPHDLDEETMAMTRDVTVNDKMQTGYRYTLSEPAGAHFAPDFKPHYTPQVMLEMGVFEGRYLNDCTREFPKEWFQNAKVSREPDATLNFFGVKSRQSLGVWGQRGWILDPDPRGWFQWYCRYFQGRRIPDIDRIQIKRWKGFARHAGQIRANCHPGDVFCRPRQRQGLLQWSHDPLI